MDTLTSIKVAGTLHEGKSSTENNPIPKENAAADDGEISIFNAEKYFSEEIECINESKKEQGENLQKSSSFPSSDGYGRSFMAKSTPSASSEASWNSKEPSSIRISPFRVVRVANGGPLLRTGFSEEIDAVSMANRSELRKQPRFQIGGRRLC